MSSTSTVNYITTTFNARHAKDQRQEHPAAMATSNCNITVAVTHTDVRPDGTTTTTTANVAIPLSGNPSTSTSNPSTANVNTSTEPSVTVAKAAVETGAKATVKVNELGMLTGSSSGTDVDPAWATGAFGFEVKAAVLLGSEGLEGGQVGEMARLKVA